MFQIMCGNFTFQVPDYVLDFFKKKSDKYKQKILYLIGRSLKKDNEKRSLKEYWDKVKSYFKNLQIQLKEKYLKFGEWVKNTFKDKFLWNKSEIENIKSIAQEVILYEHFYKFELNI